MRERIFKVPVDLMAEFATIMQEQEMDNVIEGVAEDGDIEIRVDYEPEQKQVIGKIHDMIDEYNENQEDDEEEEEEEDED